MNGYELTPDALRALPDETPVTIWVEPEVLNLQPRRGGPRLVDVSSTLGAVRAARVPEPGPHREPGC